MKILSQGTAADLIPANATLDDLRRIAASCKACDLWKRGTQTVFGEGNPHAGDKEDLKGHPFVGTAGALLDKALVAAGIDRSKVYVTNVVKHFKWEPRGSRRIHKKRNIREITACRPWLDAEIRLVKPRAIVLLGATAAQALLGSKFRSPNNAANRLIRDWLNWCLPPCIPRRFCAHPMTSRGIWRCNALPMISRLSLLRSDDARRLRH